MKLVYFPVIWPTALSNRWVATPLDAMDPRLRGTAASHPYALISFADAAWRNQRCTWEPEDVIFGDSGGYSAATRGEHFDPSAVIRWQIARCTVGAVLDAPPWRDWTQRRACLAATVANVKAALPIYLWARDAGTAFRWWGVVHGRTHAELVEWHDAVSGVYPFTDPGEGFCFKPHPLNDPAAMRHVLTFIQERGIRAAHFFATSGLTAVEVLCAYGAPVGLDLASFDSTSALKRGFWRTLILPTPTGWEAIQERFRESGGRDTRARDYMELVCVCASCAWLRLDLQAHGELRSDENYLRQRIMFHNILATRTVYDMLQGRYKLSHQRETAIATQPQTAA